MKIDEIKKLILSQTEGGHVRHPNINKSTQKINLFLI